MILVDGASGMWLGHEGRTLMNRLGQFIPWENIEKKQPFTEPESKLSAGTKSSGVLILDFLTFKTVRHKLLFKSSGLWYICYKSPNGLRLLGTALPGFRGYNPSWLRLSQSWDHKPLRRQSLSPWQKCHFCPLHPAWPWAWPVSQRRVRILKGGST